MEMRRYVRHSPAWWIVGGILALLTAGCIVLGLLAQRDSAAAEAVPIGDEIYLGDYNYIDVQYMTTWAYRVTLGDGRKLVFYLAEDTEGYGYLVQLNDAEYARYADIVDYTYADDSGDGAVPDDTAAPSELAVYIPLTETTAPAPVRLVGVICETPEAYIDDIAAAVGMTAEDFVYTYGDYYIDSELTPDTGSSFWSLIASFLGLAAFVLLVSAVSYTAQLNSTLKHLKKGKLLERAESEFHYLEGDRRQAETGVGHSRRHRRRCAGLCHSPGTDTPAAVVNSAAPPFGRGFVRKKHPLSGVLFYSVDGADEVHAAFLHMYVQADPVAAYVAAGILVDTAILRAGEPLVEKGTAAGGHTQQGGTAVLQNDGLIALVRSEGDDAHMVEQAVKAVGLEHIAGQIGVDVLRVVAGLQDQRLAVHVADTGEAVDRRSLPQLHLLADGGLGDLYSEVHQRRGGDLAHRGDLGGEGIADTPAVGGGVGHEGAAAALADHQTLVLQLSDGLTDGVAADAQAAAELGLAGEQRTHRQGTGGDAALDDAHQLGVEGDIAVQRQRSMQNGVLFHGGVPFPCVTLR